MKVTIDLSSVELLDLERLRDELQRWSPNFTFWSKCPIQTDDSRDAERFARIITRLLTEAQKSQKCYALGTCENPIPAVFENAGRAFSDVTDYGAEL